MEITKQQARFIKDKAYISPVNDAVYIIYIGDGNDEAYSLDVIDILEANNIKYWNEENGVKYILTVEFMHTIYKFLAPKSDINCGYLYTGLGVK